MTDIDTFRQDVREWLEAHCPISQRQPIVREEQIWAGSQSRFPLTMHVNGSKPCETRAGRHQPGPPNTAVAG